MCRKGKWKDKRRKGRKNRKGGRQERKKIYNDRKGRKDRRTEKDKKQKDHMRIVPGNLNQLNTTARSIHKQFKAYSNVYFAWGGFVCTHKIICDCQNIHIVYS